jgi:hypothetical protein
MASIKVPGQWDALSADDKRKVTDLLSATGVLKPGTNLVADAQDANLSIGDFNPIKEICKAACSAAEGAAVAACASAGAPPVVAICIVAAHAAGEACRNGC